jgi:V/A-type H+/Na+-transporting ATPase subunit D
MSEHTPTRSAVLELRDERRAMDEGHRFLEEKCLLLAGEMLRELARYERLARRLNAAWEAAVASLVAAVARHGLEALEVHPAPKADASRVEVRGRSLIGVRLLEAQLMLVQRPPAPTVDRSPEGEACRIAFAALATIATEVAAASGNLERLHAEYRRAVRRARALQDVLLPEIDRTLAGLEMRLAELEQEDAIWMRQGR